MAEFLPAYNRTREYEGGWLIDKDGRTYCGILESAHPASTIWKLLDKYQPLKRGQIIKGDTDLESEVKRIYYTDYWLKIRGSEIDSQIIAEFIYDWDVNSGKQAVKMVQQVLSLDQDGRVGSQTLNAINNEFEATLLQKLIARRKQWVEGHCKLVPADLPNRKGWLNRIAKFE